MERRLLVNACSDSVDWITAGVVELTSGYLACLRARRQLFEQAHAADAEVVELVFLDPSCAFHDFDADGHLTAPQLEHFNKEGWVELGETIVPTEPERTEADTLVISLEGVSWRCSPRDTVELVETELVPYEEVFGKENT
jgi:hypothetical protein